jgi:hypothetical protein
LEEAGDRLFTFTRLPESQWKSARTTDEIDKKFLARLTRNFSLDLLFCQGTGDWVARAGFEDEGPVAQPQRRASFAAPVRRGLDPRGCHPVTNCS